MKKPLVISIALIILGFVFEYFYFVADNIFFDVKFWVSGVLCIIIGCIGVWLYGVLPMLENK